MSIVNKTLLLALSLFLVAPLGACDKKDELPETARSVAAEPIRLRLGYRPRALVDISPIVIAETNPTSRVVHIELVPISSPPEAFARFNAGELDAIAGMPTEAVFAQMSEADESPKFVAYAAQVDLKGAGWVAIVASPNSGVTSVAQLAGKTTASLPTDQANWLLKRTLEAAGVPKDQIRVARYTMTNPIAGFRSGEHAAIFGPEPANAMAIAEGGVVLARGPLSELLYDGGPVPVAVSVVSTKFAESHPDAYAEFLHMTDSAVDLCASDPARVREFFGNPKYGGFAPEVRARFELPVMVKPDSKLIQVTRRFVNDLVRDGLLKTPIDPERLFRMRP